MFEEYSNKELDSIFEDYLHQRLSPKTMQQVQKELKENEDFRNNFENFIMLVEGITEYERDILRNNLKLVNSPPEKFEAKTAKRTRLYYSIASVFAVVVSVILLLSILSKSTSPEQLFESSYLAPVELPLPISRGMTQMDEAIQKAYQTESYTEAESLIPEELLAENDAYKLSLAIVKINLEKYSEALKLLNQIEESASELIHEKQWYSALVHLKLGNTDTARQLLNQLSTSKSTFADRARDILNQLD